MSMISNRLKRLEEALSVKPGTFRSYTRLELAVRICSLLSTGKLPDRGLEILKNAKARKEEKERRIHNEN